MAQPKKDKTQKEKLNLQGALTELEKVVNELSKKDVDVDAGMAKFKRGVELIKFCRSELEEVENEFNDLKAELEIEDDDEDGEGDDEEEEDNSEEEDIKPEDLPF